MTTPVELLPPRRQALWGWPAVANFALGGLGAGLYVVAVSVAGLARSPAVALASWLGPLLVLAGFAAVATEAGRPWRGARVLARLGTSWMSRELLLGGLFVLFAATDLAVPLRVHRALAMLAAVGLGLAQGYIVRGARGVTAWDVPLMPVLFLLSSLISGAGLALVVEVLGGRHPGDVLLGGALLLLGAGLAAWARYLRWPGGPAFAQAIAPLGRGPGARLIAGGGYTAPLALIALAALLPSGAGPALVAAGALMVGAQVYAKALLILAAGQFRPVTLGRLRIGRMVGEAPHGGGVPGHVHRRCS